MPERGSAWHRLLEGAFYWAFQELNWLAWGEALISVGPQQVFVSAIVNMVLFTSLALIITLAGRVVRWPGWPVFTIGILSFLFLLPLVDLSGRLRLRGSAILALGLCVQLTRWIDRRRPIAFKFIRRTLPALAAAVAVLGVIVWGGSYLLEGYKTRRLPAPAVNASNVLLIVLDTVRADHLSCYGYPRPTTPSLDRLASEGVLFERAYATSSWTLPSHASMMTGLLPFEHKATVRRDRAPLAPRLPVLAEAFNRHGYISGGFVANTVFLTPWMGLDRGFLHYESYYSSPARSLRRSYYGRELTRWLLHRIGDFDTLLRPSALDISQALLNWLDQNPGRPFFAFLNLMEAHQPIRLPDGFAKKRFDRAPPGRDDRIPPRGINPREMELRTAAIGEYDSALSYLDAQLGALFQEMARRGLYDNTLVIVTSDHGEHFGQNGMFDHGNSLYEEELRVPLILRLPGPVPAGRRIPVPASLRDLAATALDIAQPGTAHSLGGRSLVGYWNSPEPVLRAIVAEIDGANFPSVPEDWPIRKGWVKCIIFANWKYELREDGIEQLFDLAADPLGRNNLVSTPKGQEKARSLREQLRAINPEVPSAEATRGARLNTYSSPLRNRPRGSSRLARKAVAAP